MKIGILSRNPRLYSTSRLLEEAIASGHQCRVIDTLKCYMDISSAKPAVWYRGQQLDHLDAIVPRIGASITNYGTAVIRLILSWALCILPAPVPVMRSLFPEFARLIVWCGNNPRLEPSLCPPQPVPPGGSPSRE